MLFPTTLDVIDREAELPPTSAYTYAVQLSADERTAAGARDVVLDRSVPLYVDDFLGMPVGMSVPFGAYDATRGEWIPEENGVVLEPLVVRWCGHHRYRQTTRRRRNASRMPYLAHGITLCPMA